LRSGARGVFRQVERWVVLGRELHLEEEGVGWSALTPRYTDLVYVPTLPASK
jgi:hypothetical protein